MIFFETAHQPRVLLLLLAGGLLAGALYDGVSFLRRKAPPPLAFLLDAAYALVLGVIAFLALAWAGENALRAYALPALLCGAALYALGLRRVFR